MLFYLSLSLSLSHLLSRVKPALVAGQRVNHEVVVLLHLIVTACTATIARCGCRRVVRAYLPTRLSNESAQDLAATTAIYLAVH